MRRLQRARASEILQPATGAVLPARRAALHPRQVGRRRPAPHPLPRPRLRPLPRRPAHARSRAGRRGRDHLAGGRAAARRQAHARGRRLRRVRQRRRARHAGVREGRRQRARRRRRDRVVPDRPPGGSGQNRTFSGGPLPGVLGGALRIEFWTKRKRGKRRKWVRVHAQTKSARSPWVVRQRLRFRGTWRMRLVFLGKPPHKLTRSCWMYFSTRNKRVRFQCPRGTVPFPSRRR